MTQSLVQFVKHRRKQLGLTQVDLADRSGVGLRFIREMEQGKQTLRLDKVNQVLALFGHVMAPVLFSNEEMNDAQSKGSLE
jgi:y4mF family transcriptional regulator